MDKQEKFTVIQDTREQKPWKFTPDKLCAGTLITKLDTADYSLVGWEEEFIIERKGSTSEVCTNIYEKRFEKELERMSHFKFPFIICEFNWDDVINFPINSGIPKGVWHKVKMSGEFMRSCLIRYQLEYNVKVIFAGVNGDIAAMELFKHLTRLRSNGKI
jgi:ERCC4-type nuclease